MRVSETLQDGDPARYEQRFTACLGSIPLHFVRRPVAIEPPVGTVCFIDDGPRHGAIQRRDGAGYEGAGKWKGAKFEPTHWTYFDDEAPKHGA